MYMSNTEILMYVLGWQGGTIHQLADVLGVTTDIILKADDAALHELCRLAQTIRQAQPSTGNVP
jgi:hypothetical protein